MRDEDRIELELNRAAPRERLTAAGAAVLFFVITIVIIMAVHMTGPNLTIGSFEPDMKTLTEKITGE